MLGDSEPAAKDAESALSALWQGLLLTALAVAGPWLSSTSQAELVRVSRRLWAGLPDASDASIPTLWPTLRASLLWLPQALLPLAALSFSLLFFVWWLGRRFRSAGLPSAEARSAVLLGPLLWGMGLVLLLPRWLGLYTWPGEAYGAAALDGLRGILGLAGGSYLLRAALRLLPPR
jgi:hypothetical protein